MYLRNWSQPDSTTHRHHRERDIRKSAPVVKRGYLGGLV